MLGFAHPAFLLLAPLAVAVVWWSVRRRRPALRYSDTRLVDGLPRGRAPWATWGGAILRSLATLALIVAAAGPRTPDLRTRLPVEGIAIVLVLDVSGSMANPDFALTPSITRLDAARQAFRLFVEGGEAPDGTRFEGRGQDQIGLVAFAAVPETVCPLTLNHSVLLKVLDAQTPREGVDAGTNIGDAIAEGLARLEAAGKTRKVLILLSDGEHNIHMERKDGPLKPVAAARLAQALGVAVHAIDCGGEPRPGATEAEIKQRADGQRVLQTVAETTGGKSFTATNTDELRAVYREIDQLERDPTQAFRYRRYHEYAPWCAAVAIALLGAVYGLERTWWRRVP